LEIVDPVLQWLIILKAIPIRKKLAISTVVMYDAKSALFNVIDIYIQNF
jgi:hypothetical protein